MSNREAIKAGIKAIYREGDTVEIRAWDKQHTIQVGRYKFGPGLLDALCRCEDAGLDIYYELNPTPLPVCSMGPGSGTKKHEVIRRRWFLLDCDAKRWTEIGEKLNEK